MNRLDHNHARLCHESGDGRQHRFKNRFGSVEYGSSDGFTLLEILVAIMLLAVALTVVLQQFSGAMNAGRAAHDYTRAVWHAREKLAEVELTDPLVPGAAQGVFEDGYQWETMVTYFAPDGKEPLNNPIPFLIRLRIHWPNGRSQKQLDIDTIVLSRTEG